MEGNRERSVRANLIRIFWNIVTSGAIVFIGAGVIFLVATFLAPGCATVAESLKDTTYYRRDIRLKVNGQEGLGVLVVEPARTYKIEGENEGDFDYLSIRSCHRQYLKEKDGGHFSYTYEPIAGIEDNRACPLEVRGFESAKSRDSFGFIDFKSPREQLPAQIQCNGASSQSVGVSACMAPAGLLQKIKFQEPVEVAVRAVDGLTLSSDCAAFPQVAASEFLFKMPKGQCQVIFMAQDKKRHRMTTLGYDDSVVRKF